MTDTLRFDQVDEPDESEAAVVGQGLRAFNREKGHIDEVKPLSIFARDGEETVVAGLLARTWGKCCEVVVLWVREDHRKRGIGSRLMREIECAAGARGCELIYLDTFSFQAPDFYKALGYRTDRVIEGFPHGYRKIYMSKAVGTGQSPQV